MFSSIYPIRRYFTVRSEIAALHKEERALDGRITALTEQKARFSSDQEVERLARQELAMVRPGEVAFVIVTPKPARQVRAPEVGPGGLEAPERPARPSLLSRWFGAFVRSARLVR
jgi:hypothetical protein